MEIAFLFWLLINFISLCSRKLLRKTGSPQARGGGPAGNTLPYTPGSSFCLWHKHTPSNHMCDGSVPAKKGIFQQEQPQT